MTIVNTNFNSVFATVQLGRIERAISQATVRISSGSKLNNAGDNPTGVMAATWFKSYISGIGKAESTAGDVNSMLSVADSALGEITDYLISMRDLALSAANDATLTAADRAELDAIYQDYLSKGPAAPGDPDPTDVLDKAANAEYNGIKLLDGTFSGGKTVVVGPSPAADSISVTIDNVSAILTATVAGTDILSVATAGAAITAIDSALDQIGSVQSRIGGTQNQISLTLTGLGNQEINMAAALSNITDADMAAEISQFARLQILAQSSTAVLAQGNYVTERIISILDKL